MAEGRLLFLNHFLHLKTHRTCLGASAQAHPTAFSLQPSFEGTGQAMTFPEHHQRAAQGPALSPLLPTPSITFSTLAWIF